MFRSIVLLSLPFMMGCAHAHAQGPVSVGEPGVVHSHSIIHASPAIVVEWTWVHPKAVRGRAPCCWALVSSTSW